MNNNINPDEVLSDAELAALEAKLSVITDVSRSDSDVSQLSESERIQAQTFDKLISLANRGIELKPVSFTIPSAPLPPSRATGYKKRIGAIAVAAVVLVSALILAPMSVTRIFAPASDSNNSVIAESAASVYWTDSFDNQLSEFEGEMICLSANYDNLDVAVESMYYLEDYSEVGDF